MCGRFVLHSPAQAIREVFALDDLLAPLSPRYNIAPTQPILIVRQADGRRVGEMARWGLIPSWSKTIGRWSTFNARAETVADRPMYRVPFRRRRCLIPADGYYEWTADNGKQPWYIHAASGDLLALAGLFDAWTSPQGETIVSATIIVCDASPDTRHIHARMPVILPSRHWERWLDPLLSDPAALQPLLRPAPKGRLSLWPVSRAVNASRHQGAALIAPIRP